MRSNENIKAVIQNVGNDAPSETAYPGGYWAIEQFGDGTRARVWKDGEMPKFHERWAKAVVYMFGSPQEARTASLKDDPAWPQRPGAIDAQAATGLLVDVHGKNRVHQYVITNRHVVDNGLVYPRFSFKDPQRDCGYVADTAWGEWYTKILPTDLAVLPLQDDLVKTSVEGLDARSIKERSIEFYTNIGDDVAMPGRFYLSVVVPWFKVSELLNSPVLVERRAELDRKLDSDSPPMVRPD